MKKYDIYKRKYSLSDDYIELIYAHSDEEAIDKFMNLRLSTGWFYELENEAGRVIKIRNLIGEY